MKKLLRKLLKTAAALFLLALVLTAGLSVMARKYVSEEALVRLAEENINSRVHIGKAELSVFRFPACITLKEVALGERDDEIGKPLAERAPLDLKSAPVQVSEVRLSVSLLALLKRKVEIREFVFRKPRLEVTLHEEGGNSLDELLRTPGSARDERERTPAADRRESGKDDEEVLNTRSLNVYVHGFLAQLHELKLEEGALDLVIEKTGMVVKVRDLKAHLDQLHLDPSAIEKTNTARARLAARVLVDAVSDKDLRYAEFVFEGPAEADLFDPVSGDLDLDIRGQFELGEECYLNARVPVVQKAWALMQKLEAVGIEIEDLPERATPGRARSIAVRYHGERFTLLEPLSLWFKDWELALLEGAWVQTGQAEHAARVEVLAEAQLSDKLRKQIGRGVDFLPGELRPLLVEEVEATWFREGRLLAELESEGELSSPNVALRNALPDVKRLVQRAGERLLDGGVESLLKGILGD